MITVSGKAFANGTGTLSTYADNDTEHCDPSSRTSRSLTGRFRRRLPLSDLVKADRWHKPY